MNNTAYGLSTEEILRRSPFLFDSLDEIKYDIVKYEGLEIYYDE